MKNKLFWSLVGIAAAVLTFLLWVALGSAGDLGLADPVAAVCSVAVLVVALVAWEFLMKPGYGRLSRRDATDVPEDEAEGPPSAPRP